MPRTKEPIKRGQSRRANKPKAEYYDYYSLVFRKYAESDKVPRKDDNKLKEFDQVCREDDLFGVFKGGIVMVDCDTHEQSDILLRILDDCGISYLYQRTTRGIHAFFYHGKWSKLLKDKNKITSACGLEIDYKCYSVDGTKLSKTLDTGEVQPRPLLTSPNWTGDLVDLPHFLVSVHATEDFQKLTDCRNETFYIYILKLLRYGLDKEQTKHTIRLINNYVIPNPIGARELDIILRDEAFPDNNEIYIYSNDPKKAPKLDYELFANHLIEKHHIIKSKGRYYVYESGVYEVLNDYYLRKIIMQELKNTSKNTRLEIREYIEDQAQEKEEASYNYIAFNDCLVDLFTGNPIPFNKDIVIFNRFPHNYKLETQDKAKEIIESYFSTLTENNSEITKLLIDIMGYCMIRSNSLGLCFLIPGTGGNGKSKYFGLITALIGGNHIKHISIKQMEDPKCVRALDGSLVNISDDINSDYIADSSDFKKLVTGEVVTAWEMYKGTYEFVYRGKLLFSCNKPPRWKDTSEGFKDRVIVLPFKARLRNTNKQDINILEKITSEECLEYLSKLAVQSASQILRDKKLIIPKSVRDSTDAFHNENNPIQIFLDYYGDIHRKYIKDVYRAYSVWCVENNFKPYNSIEFAKGICSLGYKSQSKDTTKTERSQIGNDYALKERAFYKILPLEVV